MREHLVAVGATLLGIAGACWIAGASVEKFNPPSRREHRNRRGGVRN